MLEPPFEEDLARERVRPVQLPQVERAAEDARRRLGGDAPSGAHARVFAGFLLVPEDVELVLLSRLHGEPQAGVLILVGLMEPVVRVELIVGAELAFIEVAIADEEIVLAVLTPRGP